MAKQKSNSRQRKSGKKPAVNKSPMVKTSFEPKKPPTPEPILRIELVSLARYVVSCASVIILILILTGRDQNLVIEVLKILGGGGVGYGLGRQFPK